MAVYSKHSFRKREASLLLLNTRQRGWLEVFSKVSTETSRKTRSVVPWCGTCFQHKNITRCWELGQPELHLTGGLARRQCRNRGLGTEQIYLQMEQYLWSMSEWGRWGTGPSRSLAFSSLGGLLLTAPHLLLLSLRMASTISRQYSWGWSKDKRERDGRAPQAWERGDISFPCLLE